MKRKIICGICNDPKNTVTVEGSSILLMSVNRISECWDCGESRRDNERKRRNRNRKKIVERYARGVEQG